MILYDFRCPAGHVTEHLLKLSQRTEPQECPTCGAKSERVVVDPPKWDYGRMAVNSDSPEFIDRFERSHLQQKEKERRSLEEHGDYGPRPGAD